MSVGIYRALLPRDGLFCKDGRGWHTSAVGRSHAYPWPPPSALRGALRMAYGQSLLADMPVEERARFTASDWDQRTSDLKVTGLLTLRRPFAEPGYLPGHRMWPVPADAYYGEDEIHPLCPTRSQEGAGTLGNGNADDETERLWHARLKDEEAGKGAPRPRFWNEDTFVAWL